MSQLNNVEINSTPEKWYRVGMVWLMIGLPFAVVVASMVTIGIAHKNAPIIIERQAASD